ncbi:MAG: esterase [Pyrinomonadaceae bacterium]|nr:esterase [Pyrinomonadaceae bacterium]
MKKLFITIFALSMILAASVVFGQRLGRNRVPGHLQTKQVKVGDLKRSFFLFVPKRLEQNKKVPLLFVFHGGGGNPLAMDQRLGFTELARKERFVVVYPEGIGRNWNDGRETDTTQAHREKVDDIGFVSAIIDRVSEAYRIDQKRIFATGPSNGGIFSHYVGANLSERFAAIAPVIGGIADPFYKRFNPKDPVSVFVIQGTEDRLVPYDGTNGIGFGRRRNRGKIISTDRAIALWTKHNRVDARPIKSNLPDKDSNDGCTVETFLWKNGKNNTAVKLFKMNGGGHTWAGGQQYLPRRIVGNVCRDFDATDEIWSFFKAHPKP